MADPIRGLLDTSDYEATIKKLDVRDKIFELQPNETPFISILSKMTKLKAQDIQFFWFEDDLLGNYTTLGAAATTDTSETYLTVADSTMLAEGDVLGLFSQNSDVAESEENVLVTGITSDTRIEVRRAWGNDIAAHDDEDYVYKLGSSMQEGYDAPESLVTAKDRKDNYVQIFSKTVTITNTAENIETYGGNRRNFERHKVAVELKRELESQFLWGAKKIDTTGAHPRYQTDGVYTMMGTNTNKLDMGGASLTESAWEGWLRTLFEYGGQDRFFFSGPLILSQISQFAAAKQRIEAGTTIVYGVKVRKYHSTLGDVNLVLDRHFNGPHAGKGLALDMNELVYRYLQNSDFTLALNIQPKNAHYKLDEYTGTVGLEMHHAELHGQVEYVG